MYTKERAQPPVGQGLLEEEEEEEEGTPPDSTETHTQVRV